MDYLTKGQIQALLKLEEKSRCWFGEFDLFVKGFGKRVNVSITLWQTPGDLDDRTVQTVNEIANLTEDHYQQILRLLFDDAMIFKENCCSVGSSPPPEIPPTNWLRRLVRRFNKDTFVELAFDDPRHPLFGINTPEDVGARIEWEGFQLDDAQETTERIAFLTCYPPWELEHGREIAILNGTPVGIDEIQLNPYFYVEADSDE